MPNKEVELKLELAPASLPALKKVPLLRSPKSPPTQTREISVYFDTNKRKLRKKGLMLRVRRIGKRHVQTIKAAGNSAPFERDEWEAEIAGEEPDLSLAGGTALEPLVNGKLGRQLKPLFETRVRRTVYPIADDTRAIALTIDRGTIEFWQPIGTVVRGGARARARDDCRSVRCSARARPSSSRAPCGQEQIGTRLRAHRRRLDAPVKAVPLTCPPPQREASRSSVAPAEAGVGRAAVIKGDQGVHQMRVGLRRLRAAISLFSGILRDAQTAAIKVELKWLTGELGPARELDVLVKRVVAPVQRQHARCDGMPSLSQEFAEKREVAHGRARDAAKSARFRTLTLEVAAWIEAGQCTKPQDELVRDRGNLSVAVSAAEQLTRRWRKVRKKGKALAQLDARSRHKLRIQAKKLRYAAEFFSSLFTSKRAAKRRGQFLAALERLQDGLGDLNDIAVHEQRIAAMGIRPKRSNPKRAFAAGLLTGREDARIDAAMAAAMQAYADLAKVKPFWP